MAWVIQGEFTFVRMQFVTYCCKTTDLVRTLYILFIHIVFRHGWASSMGAVRSPHVKVICPTAYVVVNIFKYLMIETKLLIF